MRTLIAASMLAIGLVCSASSAPDVQKQDGQPTETAKGAQPKERGTEANPIFVKSLPGPESEAEARHKEYEHHEKPLIERLMGWGTLALAIFTALLFMFTAALWWVTLQLGREAKRTAAQQAIDTQESLRIAKDTAQRQLRAYVTVDIEAVKDVQGNQRIDQVGLFFKNVGQTPANNVESAIAIGIRPVPLVEELPIPPMTGITAVLFPGQSRSIELPMPVMEQAQAGAAIAGTLSVYIWGRIQYEDAFGVARITNICALIKPTGGRLGWALFSAGNTAT